MEKLGLLSPNTVYYIGGSDVLPPPLKGQEEQDALEALELGDEAMTVAGFIWGWEQFLRALSSGGGAEQKATDWPWTPSGAQWSMAPILQSTLGP